MAYGLASRLPRGRTLRERALDAEDVAATLVDRRAVDLVRREPRAAAEPLEVVEPAAGEATDEKEAVREQRRAVQAALRLPAREQRLAVPLGTVESRIFAGLRTLRELLSADL